ncbi:MAG: hypothetical protein R2758_06985 [Bacteroidales bacterium]
MSSGHHATGLKFIEKKFTQSGDDNLQKGLPVNVVNLQAHDLQKSFSSPPVNISIIPLRRPRWAFVPLLLFKDLCDFAEITGYRVPAALNHFSILNRFHHVLQTFSGLIDLTFISACNNQQDSDHGTESEELKVNYTAYSDIFEVFAEADPFVTGVTSNVLSHFTTLSDFKPLSPA